MKPQIKTRGSNAGDNGLRPWLLRGTLLIGLALAVAQPSLAQSSVGSGGSESVGSLPDPMPPGPMPPGHGGITPVAQQRAFRLVLTGREADLRDLVVEARSLQPLGGGSWQLTRLEVPGMARLVCEGAVELVLDRRVLERSFASFSVELGAPFSGGAVSVASKGLRRTRSVGVLGLDLHLQQLSWSGLADQGVTLQAVMPQTGTLARRSSRLDISATADTVRLVQSPHLLR